MRGESRVTLLIAIALIATLGAFALSVYNLTTIRSEQDRLDAEIAHVDSILAGELDGAVRQCQSDNELRRALGQLEAEGNSRTEQVLQSPNVNDLGLGILTLQPNAKNIVDCRAFIEEIRGVDPGEVPNFLP